MFVKEYQGKKVLITGHTGFKGSWLTTWLLKSGAEVIGVSIDVPTNPSMFESLNLKDKIDHHILDVKDLASMKTIIEKKEPDFIFHLAAQAIVSKSYDDPINTISTNIIGTANILECLRGVKKKCTAVIITSDKCYDNVEWVWGYKETDPIGGKDIYSGSKGGAELIIKSYYHSFLKDNKLVKIAVGRAGNVIGGGDWAPDRIIVDTIKAWSQDQCVEIRSPHSTRPWQHVLEPLSGYLQLGIKINENKDLDGQSFNFGPKTSENVSVLELLKLTEKKWESSETKSRIKIIKSKDMFKEAGLLKLNCDKALHYLEWESCLFLEETINFIVNWYKSYYKGSTDLYQLTLNQITEYEKLAYERKSLMEC